MKTTRQLVVIHGGQTGVDRGAHKGALDAGFHVTGYMPSHGRDEDGPIPGAVACHLRRCAQPGFAARTRANLAITDSLLVVVENRADPYATPGTKLTLEEGRRLGLPRLIADEELPVAEVARWLWSIGLESGRHRAVSSSSPRPTLAMPPCHRLMIAGPRASLWPRGELVAAAIVRAIATVAVCPIEGHDWVDDKCTRCEGRRPRRVG